MSFSMAPLLIHSPDVSQSVREALQAAYASDPADRIGQLMLAAQLLHRETELECADVRELVGLPSNDQ